jgi:cyclopropane fatty-acyl-phospholipid synthase-like methyltransferase
MLDPNPATDPHATTDPRPMPDPRAAHFDRLFCQSEDPWNYRGSAYERAKYDATLAVLPQARFASVIEVGCANGELAARLADRADRYLGLDCAARAVELARRRLSRHAQARVRQCFVPRHWPRRRADLIVLSEVVYYLTPEEIGALCERIDGSLLPGGAVVIVCWTGETGTKLSGREALQLTMSGLVARGGYRCGAPSRATGYDLALLSKTGPHDRRSEAGAR